MTTAATNERPTLQMEWDYDCYAYTVLIGGNVRGMVTWTSNPPQGPATVEAWRGPSKTNLTYLGTYTNWDAAINAVLGR
jgi:uncharacterized membrane protein YagU involved in acid resistance